DLTLNPSAVTYVNSGTTLTQSNRSTDTFYRLYGDFSGDQTVNNLDRGRFNLAYGTSAGDVNYVAAFDLNGDGTINNLDRAKFNLNFGKSLTGFTPTI